MRWEVKMTKHRVVVQIWKKGELLDGCSIHKDLRDHGLFLDEYYDGVLDTGFNLENCSTVYMSYYFAWVNEITYKRIEEGKHGIRIYDNDERPISLEVNATD